MIVHVRLTPHVEMATHWTQFKADVERLSGENLVLRSQRDELELLRSKLEEERAGRRDRRGGQADCMLMRPSADCMLMRPSADCVLMSSSSHQ